MLKPNPVPLRKPVIAQYQRQSVTIIHAQRRLEIDHGAYDPVRAVATDLRVEPGYEQTGSKREATPERIVTPGGAFVRDSGAGHTQRHKGRAGDQH